jgi:hypothetical protein
MWGIGQVLRNEGDKVRVLFSEAGEKPLDLRFATLEEVEAPADVESARPQLRARTGVDIGELETLCNLFHDQFKDRRSSTDDGRMAVKVLEEMKARGDLSKETARQLFRWCQTGASYTEGIELAQQICRLIYGHLPTRAEIDAAGLG